MSASADLETNEILECGERLLKLFPLPSSTPSQPDTPDPEMDVDVLEANSEGDFSDGSQISMFLASNLIC